MNTDDLILRLARDTRPVRRGAVWRRIAIGVAIGGMVAALLTAIGMGMRPDLGVAMQGPAFWIKWGYTLSLSAVALAVTAQLARPDTGRVRGLWLIAVPVMLLACLGFLELARTPPSAWLTMWLGQSWKTCPWRVLSLSAPIFAGAAAGLSAGAFAATVYCLHCPEVSAIFVLTWYSLGILLATLLGALLGPRLLRW